jgi:hypothetical protein
VASASGEAMVNVPMATAIANSNAPL